MSIRTIVVVILALICGGSAAIGVNGLVHSSAPATELPPTTPVVVAAVDLPRGTLLKPEMLRISQWPAALAPAGTQAEVETVMDRAALTSFVAGEPILGAKIAKDGLGAAALIRPGMRAYTIQTPTESSGVAGFILPGNRVDVLLTVTDRSSASTGGGSTSTLLQNVEILAVGQRLDQTDNANSTQPTRSVTLLVNPDMAAKLTLAQSVGTLALTLRNDADTSVAETDPITMRELRFLEEFMQPIEKPPAPVVVEPDPTPDPQPAPPAAEPEEAPVSTSVTPPRKKPAATILTLRGTSAGIIQIVPRGQEPPSSVRD